MTLFSKTSTGPSQRQLKVGAQVRNIISEVLTRSDFHSPVLAKAHVCISEVRMSPDLRHGRAYVTSIMGDNMTEATKALNENEYQIRKVLSKELTMKFLPRIHFVEDEAFYEANKINSLLVTTHVAQDIDEPTTTAPLTGDNA
tara:strand:- start:3491 stop:3919 length:429 start_codon:yes stop_codon:yes gene_type:complete